MKKLGFTVLLLCCVMVLSACSEKESSNAFLEDWGKNQKISFSERDESGNVFVVNEKGETVLDVSSSDGAMILVDEVTEEPRMIRVDTINGTREVEGEGGVSFTANTYSYQYFDTFGNSLIDETELGIFSIVGSLGFVGTMYDVPKLINLNSGEVLFDTMYTSHITAHSVVVGVEDKLYFLDQEGNEIATRKDMIISMDDYSAFPYWHRSMVYSPEMLEQEEEYKNYYMYSPTGTAFSDLLEKESEKYRNNIKRYPWLKFNPYSTASPYYGEDYYQKIGLVDEKGKTMIEPVYKDIGTHMKDAFVGYKEGLADIIDAKTLKVTKSIPYTLTYYDGNFSIVNSGEYSYYIGDKEGNQISEVYSVLNFEGTKDGTTYFTGHVPNSPTNVLMNQEGKILYTDSYQGSFTFLDDGTFAVSSSSGQYVINAEGRIVKMYRTSDGYVYDEANGTISQQEGAKGQSYLTEEELSDFR